MKALAGAWLLIAGAVLREFNGTLANTFTLSMIGTLLVVFSITREGG